MMRRAIAPRVVSFAAVAAASAFPSFRAASAGILASRPAGIKSSSLLRSLVPSAALPLHSLRCSTTDATDATKAAADDDVVVDPAKTADIPSATAPAPEEKEVGTGEEMGFKTETRQLLDIVACSLYSDKEVFVRELVSNASDALEKRRHMELANPEEFKHDSSAGVPTISLTVQQSKSRFIIQDNGIGMDRDELMNNLGTIARSGSKAFVRELQEKGATAGSSAGTGSTAAAEKIIGQFGVGFYSIFMVAKHVTVFSRSARDGSKGYCWSSDGTGSYKISEAENVQVGTKIVLEVKDTELSFCTPQVVERIIKKYSNFVEFDISLNGGKLNTVQALWMKNKEEVSNEEHIDFYKFLSGAYDSPMLRLHYAVDAPLTIRALLYIPQAHTEKYGGGRMESGVNLYCRRVLIQSKAKNLLPDWLRFIKGAIDCENIPLNISREHTQDGALMRKLNTVMTKRVIRWLEDEAKRDKVKYENFMKEFGQFIKEGVCTDQIHKMDLAKLLRFESTKADASMPMVGLEDYKNGMKANQTHIYYLSAPSRELALASPYYEQYKEHDLEVLVLTEPIDEFVMNHLETYAKSKLQNIETFDAANDGWVQHQKSLEEKKEPVIKKELTEAQVSALCDFITKRLTGRVGIVKATTRLKESPAVIADHESAQLRKLYKITGQVQGSTPKYNFHINPQHELVRKTYALSTSTNTDQVETAGLLVEQLFDNAIIGAGLLDDPRTIIARLNNIMTRMVKDVDEPSASQ